MAISSRRFYSFKVFEFSSSAGKFLCKRVHSAHHSLSSTLPILRLGVIMIYWNVGHALSACLEQHYV